MSLIHIRAAYQLTYRAQVTRLARLVMADRGWSQAGLARHLNRSENSLNQRVNGLRPWMPRDVEHLKVIAKAHGIKVELPSLQQLEAERRGRTPRIEAVCDTCGNGVWL